MDMGQSDVGAFLFGIGPAFVLLFAVIAVARLIRRRAARTASRRHRRHGYQGYVSYNPTADTTYLNSTYTPPTDVPVEGITPSEGGHHHQGGIDTGGQTDAGDGGSSGGHDGGHH